MPNVVVLGAGMVGGFIARQLAADSGLHVTACDRDQRVLEGLTARAQSDGARLSYNVANLADADVVRSVIEDAQLVVGAVPGHMGFATLRTVIEAGKDCVDISFFPGDALALHEDARLRGVRVITDCGVMPGLGGMLAVRFARELADAGTPAATVRILVGGLPVERRWPLEYKAPFSPVDVLEEYMRPARVREAGSVVEHPALSGCELVDFPEVGTLEAFYTDGLRTLLSTLDAPDVAEKTMRYPGHAGLMRVLRELGFLDDTPVSTSCGQLAPVELTARLLDRHWRLAPGEPEFTALRVEVDGRRCDMLDRTDPATGDSSMARTTGWPAVLAARLIIDGAWSRAGVSPPELLATDDASWGVMLAGLASAGITLEFN